MQRSWWMAVVGAGVCACGDGSSGTAAPVPISIANVPLKFVVTSVDYAFPGNASRVRYGHGNSDAHGEGVPPSNSEIGGRWRASFFDATGTVLAASAGRIDNGAVAGLLLHAVTEDSLASSEGPASSSIYRNRDGTDVPSHAVDSISLWVNPVATVTTDSSGARKIDWSWSGACFRRPSPCGGATQLRFTVDELSGKVPLLDFRATFLATLTSDEVKQILAYDPFFDPAGQPPALASDPRFSSLGRASITETSASMPSAEWSPCSGALIDEDFPVYHQMAIPTYLGTTLLIQHSVQSISRTCTAQQPGVVLATTTPGCEITADVYIDKMFGTLVFDRVNASAPCAAQ